MAHLTEPERRELQALAGSAALREDMQILSRQARQHFLQDGQVDVDRAVAFIIACSDMLDHQFKPFKKILDRDMRL